MDMAPGFEDLGRMAARDRFFARWLGLRSVGFRWWWFSNGFAGYWSTWRFWEVLIWPDD